MQKKTRLLYHGIRWNIMYKEKRKNNESFLYETNERSDSIYRLGGREKNRDREKKHRNIDSFCSFLCIINTREKKNHWYQ